MVDHKSISDAANAFKQGGIIAYPTEAVFGLGCDPRNNTALINLLNLKQRSPDKGLILLAGDYCQLQPFIDEQAITLTKLNEIKARWPAVLTQIMPAKKYISPLLTGGRGTIAVRVTKHPEVIALCEKTQQAIVSTSANLSGETSATTWQQIEQIFADKIDYLLKGDTLGLQQPSKIIDALSGKVLRP